ncbi:MAG: hypothetical protein SFZ02_10770 [bacterium]|nr:hypothetical protein [bacterium]
MEFLRTLSLGQIIGLFVAVFVVIIIAVVITTNSNQPVIIDYTLTTPTPFIEFNNTPVLLDTFPTEAP